MSLDMTTDQKEKLFSWGLEEAKFLGKFPQSNNSNKNNVFSSVQFKSLFIVYPHIFKAYKGRTLTLLLQCPIGLINNTIISSYHVIHVL